MVECMVGGLPIWYSLYNTLYIIIYPSIIIIMYLPHRTPVDWHNMARRGGWIFFILYII